jgi:hypothetical protein
VRALTPLAVLFALAACAQEVVWQKPGASDRDLAQDADGCRSQAYAAQGMTADSGRAAIVYESCMEKKGWQRTPTSKP